MSELNKGKTKEPLSLMEAVMAQEEPQPQAPFQGFGEPCLHVCTVHAAENRASLALLSGSHMRVHRG